LKSAQRTISSYPNIHADDIAAMAQTIGTAERRLGVSTDNIITTYTLCKWQYSPAYIADTDDDTCLNDNCPGTLFTMRHLASGLQRRVPNLTFPFALPITWIQHILSLSGMAELMQTWRTFPDVRQGLVAPISSEVWMENLDMNCPLGDISDGWGWCSTMAGLEWAVDSLTGDVSDRSILDPPVRVSSLPFGISLSLNTDWCVAT
jgi:hypothetical protein